MSRRGRQSIAAGLAALAVAASPGFAQSPLELLGITPERGRANQAQVLAPQVAVRGLPSNLEAGVITVTLDGRNDTHTKNGTVAGRSGLVTRVQFPLEGPIEPGQYTVSVQALAGGQQYTSGSNGLVFRVLGDPSIAVEPATLGTNTTATVVVRGSETTFTEGVTTLEAGPGMIVTRFRIDSETQITAQAATGAVPGQRTLTVATGPETAAAQIEVQDPQPSPVKLLGISAARGRAGIEPRIVVAGLPSNAGSGTISVTLADGNGSFAFPGSIVGRSAEGALVQFELDARVPPGQYNLSVQAAAGGQRYGSDALGFRVLGDPAIALLPAAAPPNTKLIVLIRGSDTSFTAGNTVVDFGEGITVAEVRVDSYEQLRVQIAVGPAEGPRLVTVTTGTEAAATPFTVGVAPR